MRRASGIGLGDQVFHNPPAEALPFVRRVNTQHGNVRMGQSAGESRILGAEVKAAEPDLRAVSVTVQPQGATRPLVESLGQVIG